MSVHVTEDHLKRAEAFVNEIKGDDGLAKVDLDAFWTDEAEAHKKVWADDCPHLPLGIRMSWECPFGEFDLDEDWYRIYHDVDYKIDLCKRYNDVAEKIVGKRLVGDDKPDPDKKWKGIKGLNDIFEAENVWHNESFWLKPAANTPQELSALLDRVEKRLDNLRDFMLPENWDDEKKRMADLGRKVPSYRGQRGPITFAMSLFGVENLIYLIMDDKGLAGRFRDLILRAMLDRAKILDDEAGLTKETRAKGFFWCDDNCAMLNADMYEFFGYPILKRIFEEFSPEDGQMRGQHSDSDMGHLLPLLGTLGMTKVNLGPNITVTEIRKHLPKAVIHGQLAPFTFSRNEEVNIVAELLRDFEMAQEKRGVVFTTAGSINNGSKLSGMRLLMSATQNLCRF